MRSRIGHWMRKWADRIDHEHAPRWMGYSFTIETGKGFVFHEGRKGCRLWYLGHAEHELAHTQADSAPEDRRRAHRHRLIEEAMTNPDAEAAGRATAELHEMIMEGDA